MPQFPVRRPKLPPLPENPVLSVCIPARNEEGNIGKAIDAISETLRIEGIPFEIVIANDNSSDNTAIVVREKMAAGIPLRLINRRPPGGFGRAIRSCLEHAQGDIIAVMMADLSDDPKNLVDYYRVICSGYDAAFGSRFVPGSVVTDYPRVKLVANRVGNKFIQILFRTKHNDLTNAFKAFRGDAIRSIMPFYASHFNITIEISLALLVRGFSIASLPINWYGRTWGSAKFKIRELGRRYFATMLKAFAERLFIHDDLLAEHEVKLVRLDSVGLQESVESNVNDEKYSGDRRVGVRRVAHSD
jgi:dolichol-phosphate mannosyltransferase